MNIIVKKEFFVINGVIILEKLISKLEKFRNSLKKDVTKENMLSDIEVLKKEVECALRSFNETTQDDYIDVAIMNLNLARKKYELKLKEARVQCRANDTKEAI